ncbi:helix-turn-helix domain-containing protein [Amycolatopsis thermoflava]|uniref:helix-turn-helix domain-containing protein n=1 Tax=Amycolatopsis thermoflava TaxID=84480 RepID=UPI003F4A65C8
MPPVNHERLRDARDERGETNASLAEAVKVSPRYMENIMCGSDDPSNRVIHSLSRALQIPVAEIKAGKNTPTGDPSDPPKQPPNTPKGPPTRSGNDTKAPGRVTDEVAA